MKKIYLLSLLGLFLAGSIIAEPAPDYFISNYDIMNFEFLRTHYGEINNRRAMQVDGYFSSYKWVPPYQYKERLSAIGLNVNQYHVLQFTLKEKDDFHYAFPLLLFQTKAGDLHELDQLTAGERIVIYGRFFNLKESEYALEVDLIETVKKGGHDRGILIDSRVPPTPTPTETVTPTPGPNLWQKIGNIVNPKETPTPEGTSTPEPGK